MSSAHSILPLLSTLLLLYSAATTAVSEHPDPFPVLDTDGDPILSGTPYYITGAFESNGNGLHLIPLNETCRNNVKLAPPKFGSKVLLYKDVEQPSGNETINVNEKVRIASFIPHILICDTFWWLNEKTGLVTVGAHFLEKHNGTFRFVRKVILGGEYYKILFCSGDRLWCPALGVNEQLLGSSTTPLIIQFQKPAKLSQVSGAMHSTA